MLITTGLPSLVQEKVAVVDDAVQYSCITEPAVILCTPPLVWNRTAGSDVTTSGCARIPEYNRIA